MNVRKAVRPHLLNVIIFLFPILIYVSLFGVTKFPYRMIDADVVKVLDPLQLAESGQLENLDHPSYTNTLFFSWGFVLFQEIGWLEMPTNHAMLEGMSQSTDLPQLVYAGRILNIVLSILLVVGAYGMLVWYFKNPYYALSLTTLITIQYGFLRSVGFIRSEATAAFFSLYFLILCLIQLREQSFHKQLLLFLFGGFLLGLGFFSKVQMLPAFGLAPILCLYVAIKPAIGIKKIISVENTALLVVGGYLLFRTFQFNTILFSATPIPNFFINSLEVAKYSLVGLFALAILTRRFLGERVLNFSLFLSAMAIGFYLSEMIYFLAPGFNRETGWANIINTFKWIGVIQGSYIKVSANPVFQVLFEFGRSWLKNYYVLYSPLTLAFVAGSIAITRGRSRILVLILAAFWVLQCGFTSLRYFANQYIMLSYTYLIAMFAVSVHDAREAFVRLLRSHKMAFSNVLACLLILEIGLQIRYFYINRKSEIHFGLSDYINESSDYRFSTELSEPVLNFALEQRPNWIRKYRESTCGDKSFDEGVSPECYRRIFSEIKNRSKTSNFL